MDTSALKSHILHTLAPAGGFASPFDLFNARRELKQISYDKAYPVSRCFEEFFSKKLDACVFAFGSGKEALEAIFSSVHNVVPDKFVGISAYTCPDIAVAAIRAGLKVMPLEVNERTLEIESAAIESLEQDHIAIIVLSNLYGLLDTLVPWRKKNSFLLVDDGCQSVLSRESGVRGGFRQGCVGVLSFGRGKALCGVGGGALVFPEDSVDALCDKEGGVLDLIQKDISSMARAEDAGIIDSVHDLLYGLCLWFFESPSLYAIPSSLPFLGLGRTEANVDYAKKGLSQSMLYHAVAQWLEIAERSRVHCENACYLSAQLSSCDVVQPFLERGFSFDGSIVPIRYPLIFPSHKHRERAYEKLFQAGLGVSTSYPTVLQAYPEISKSLLKRETPQAKRIADCILTLPVHPYVRKYDIDRMARIIADIIG